MNGSYWLFEHPSHPHRSHWSGSLSSPVLMHWLNYRRTTLFLEQCYSAETDPHSLLARLLDLIPWNSLVATEFWCLLLQ